MICRTKINNAYFILENFGFNEVRKIGKGRTSSQARFVQCATSQQYQGIRNVLISQCVHEAVSSGEPQLLPLTLSRIALHSSTDEQIIFDLLSLFLGQCF